MIDYDAVNEILGREARKPRDKIDSMIRYVRRRMIFQTTKEIAEELNSVGYPNDEVFFAIKAAEILVA